MPEADKIKEILDKAQKIVILQADNPDGDSLGSALAMEQILHELGKEPYLYCGVDMPTYLRYLPGWDRVNKDMPNQFDASIVVDANTDSLFEVLEKSGQKGWLAAKPCVVLDHHETASSLTFAKLIINKPVVATSEVIYELAQQLKWPLNDTAKIMLVASIMSDSLGLVSEATTARTIHIVGELVEGGVSLAKLEQDRRALMRKTPELLAYKGQLLQRVEYAADGRLAMVTIPWEEIEKYSPLYNPPMLVVDDMRMVEGVDVVIAFKTYPDGKVTAKLRSNFGKGICGKLAEHFGGGGHAYASGFKVTSGKPFNEIKSECIKIASEMLDNLKKEKANETV